MSTNNWLCCGRNHQSWIPGKKYSKREFQPHLPNLVGQPASSDIDCDALNGHCFRFPLGLSGIWLWIIGNKNATFRSGLAIITWRGHNSWFMTDCLCVMMTINRTQHMSFGQKTRLQIEKHGSLLYSNSIWRQLQAHFLDLGDIISAILYGRINDQPFYYLWIYTHRQIGPRQLNGRVPQ